MQGFDSIDGYLEDVERWETGEYDRKASDQLAERGVQVRPATAIPDCLMKKAVRQLIDDLAAVNIYIDNTDHLSDRQVYERIVEQVLPSHYYVTELDPAIIDFNDVYDDETRELYLMYYATEQERQIWYETDDERRPLPPRRALPYDRDRRLPK